MKPLYRTPEGVRDILGRECVEKQTLEQQIEELFRSYGYDLLETPVLEYLEVFGDRIGSAPVRELYKLVDREGDLLALRPDFTPSVARVAAMFFAEEQTPLRFCYRGPVFSQVASLQGRLAEQTQMGVEYLQDDSAEADAEVLSLVIALMQKTGLEEFQITIASVPFFDALAEEASLEETQRTALRALLAAQNRYGAVSLIRSFALPPELEAAFCALPELFGDRRVLDAAEARVPFPEARRAIDRLRRIDDLLRSYGVADYVTYDLGMVPEYRYYTGIVFRAYTYGSGEALVRGGRYDDLLSQFGKDCPAIGFMTRIDMLQAALSRSGVHPLLPQEKTMLVYPAAMEEDAIRLAMAERAKECSVACIRMTEGRDPESYREYGIRHQFTRMILLRYGDNSIVWDLKNATQAEEAFSSKEEA